MKNSVLNTGDPGALFGGMIGNVGNSVAWMTAFLLLTMVIVFGGVSGGIEKFCKIAMPALFFLLIAVVIRSVSYTHLDVYKRQKEYFDGQVEKFMKANKKYFPDAKMTYSVITDESKLPDTAISQSTIEYLTTYLYIDKNSNYRFGDDDKIPHKYSKGDVYATNTMEELYVEGNIMHLKMNTTGVTNAYRDQIMKDNASAASLSGRCV